MTSAIASSTSGPVSQADVSIRPSRLSCEERMLALIVYTQTSQLESAETQVHLGAEQLEELRGDVLRALREAREAQRDSGFWGDLADIFGSDLASIATAVAAAAAVVASGGSAAAILAVVAAGATIAADHAKELGIPSEVAMAIAVAASVAGLLCGDMKGLFKVSAQVADVAKDVKLYASIQAGVAVAAGGGAQVVQGSYEQDALYARAEGRRAEGQQDLVSLDMDEALDRLRAALDRQGDAASIASATQQQTSAGNQVILDNWAGAA
jgi:hypothetical protein